MLEHVRAQAKSSASRPASAIGAGKTGGVAEETGSRAVMVEQYSEMVRAYIELAALPPPSDSASMVLPAKVGK